MNLKKIIIGSILFFVGMSIGSSNAKTNIVTKEVPVEKIVIKEIPATCDYSTWKSLKEIDDKGFGYAADGMNLCSEGFEAISEFDVKRIENITKEMTAVGVKIKNTGVERQLILKSLGY